MIQKTLTVVIPVLNEGEELSITLSEVRRTASNNVDIIVVDDASDDGYDYKSATIRYGARYIRHQERWGSGPTKQHGINEVMTHDFIVIDSHMRFYDNFWWKEICKCINDKSNAIYCMKCKPWSAETKKEFDVDAHGGAYLNIITDNPMNFLNMRWIKPHGGDDNIVSAIPCVLGACYASSKRYWQWLRGFDGLRGYGCEEAYVSLKSWMSGGGCYLMKNLTIGHLFFFFFPYTVGSNENFLNKMFVADMLLPEEYKIRIFSSVKRLAYMTYRSYLQRREDNEELRLYLSKIFVPEGFSNFLSVNLRAQRLI